MAAIDTVLRLLKLEAKHLQESFLLNTEQVRAIEGANPCFRKRHIESSRLMHN